jgi:hypothetical protein
MHLLTVAHIAPIISLIAGGLILIMPPIPQLHRSGVLDSQRSAEFRIAEVAPPITARGGQ